MPEYISTDICVRIISPVSSHDYIFVLTVNLDAFNRTAVKAFHGTARLFPIVSNPRSSISTVCRLLFSHYYFPFLTMLHQPPTTGSRNIQSTVSREYMALRWTKTGGFDASVSTITSPTYKARVSRRRAAAQFLLSLARGASECPYILQTRVRRAAAR